MRLEEPEVPKVAVGTYCLADDTMHETKLYKATWIKEPPDEEISSRLW